jgi:methyl coenzyme M reductase subunit D
MGLPHRDLAGALEAAGLDAAIYAGWPAQVDVPAVVVSPGQRRRVPVCHVEWTLRLSVGLALSMETETLHELVEAVLAAVPEGYVVGSTTYTQRSIGSVDYVWADTDILATR